MKGTRPNSCTDGLASLSVTASCHYIYFQREYLVF